MHVLAKIFDLADTPTEYFREYRKRFVSLLENLDTEPFNRMVGVLLKASEDGRSIYVIANGGSSAVASHLVNDLGPNSLVPGQPPFRVYSLTDNIESVTAIANDIGFECVFSEQLKVYMNSGDVVIAISVSGNSENILRGASYAKEVGGTVIAWTGFNGGALAKIADVNVRIPTTLDEYGPVEDIFCLVTHVTGTYLALTRGRALHH